MADVKAIPGRTFSKLDAAWIVPNTEAAAVELLAEEYGATIDELASDADAEIAELKRQVASLTAERDAALRLADEYAALLESDELRDRCAHCDAPMNVIVRGHHHTETGVDVTREAVAA